MCGHVHDFARLWKIWWISLQSPPLLKGLSEILQVLYVLQSVLYNDFLLFFCQSLCIYRNSAWWNRFSLFQRIFSVHMPFYMAWQAVFKALIIRCFLASKALQQTYGLRSFSRILKFERLVLAASDLKMFFYGVVFALAFCVIILLVYV